MPTKRVPRQTHRILPERPYITARAGTARIALLKALELELSDVRVAYNADTLTGSYNGMLYVGKGADVRVIKAAKQRGFTIDRTHEPSKAAR
jgi:hypothetical protein